MCTALGYRAGAQYFGRTLDLDRSYGEEVCILPRNAAVVLRQEAPLASHYALLGMATVACGVPLFYDAVNEHGLCMAGLNFPNNAYYAPPEAGVCNLASFELIPWLLGRCRTVAEARVLLEQVRITDVRFSDALPPSPLHWLITDRRASLVVESMRDGVHIYDNLVGVMTNNPPFPAQLANWERYRQLRVDNGDIAVAPEDYCQGLGAVGLPGDVSSPSRFVRAAFGREHAVCEPTEDSAVSTVFHLLDSVSMLRGLCRTDAGTWDYTVYAACINADAGRYYYTTYDNRTPACVDLHSVDLEGDTVYRMATL